jgi:hypothetical protein
MTTINLAESSWFDRLTMSARPEPFDSLILSAHTESFDSLILSLSSLDVARDDLSLSKGRRMRRWLRTGLSNGVLRKHRVERRDH